MAKHLSVLRQFEVSTVSYDGGIELEHRYKACDWTDWIAGSRLTDVMKQATAHARVCDGKRQPRPEPRPSAMGSAVMGLWNPLLQAAVRSRLVEANPFVTGLPEL